jgi:hypothetical protein
VGRTSVEVVGEAVEAVGEDPTALGKDSAALGEAAVTEATVDPAGDREAVGEVSKVDPTTVGEAIVVQAWRQSRSERAGGGEMIVAMVRV